MEKEEKIVSMFNQIAPTYDRANRAMSLGVDLAWRKSACKIVYKKTAQKEISIADIACGTGDMMGVWQEMAAKFDKEIVSLVGVDPSSGMLEVAKKKFPQFKFIEALADNTTLGSGIADILSISYGIRNIPKRKESLREFNRVLKNGGHLVVLEFAKNDRKSFISKFREFYLKNIVPRVGAFISKNRAAYEYLPNSIDNFLDKNSFCDELKECGFELELVKGYSFDISTLFLAKKVKNI